MTSMPDIEPSPTVHDPIHHVAHASIQLKLDGHCRWLTDKDEPARGA